MTSTLLKNARELLRYDAEKGRFFYVVSRGKRKAGDMAGYQKTDGYRLIFVKGKWVYEHRLAWAFISGQWPADEVDHVNRTRDDNRPENLRPVTRSENMRNLESAKGWHWHGRQKCWQAMIRDNGKRLYLGRFDTEGEAKDAYFKARSILIQRPKAEEPIQEPLL